MMRFFLFLLFSQITFAQQVIKLSEGKPKGSENWTWSEKAHVLPHTIRVYNVVEPTLTAFLPPKDLATGTSVIIAPGGGFHFLSYKIEGTDIAQWLNSKGIAAFILKYRLVPCKTDDPSAEMNEKVKDSKKFNEEAAPYIPLATADGLAAVKYIRDHAKELDISQEKIGFMGFSAGGTIAVSVAYNATDESRPNFVVPIYAHEPLIYGSKVPEAKTPIFVAAAANDHFGMMPMSISIYKKWFDAKQPAELHIYEQGGHGFAMKKQSLPVDTWNDRFYEWLKTQGYQKKLYPNKYEKLYGEEATVQYQIQEWERMKTDFGYLTKYKADNSKTPATKSNENRIIYFGDSITEGWVRADSAFFNKNNYIGRGISGQTSTQLLLRFRQDVLSLKPKAVIIHIGTNDIAENTGPYNPDFTFGNIQSMTEIAQANGVKVILASVLPATKFEWRLSLGNRSAMIIDLNKRLEDYAKTKKITYIDYHKAMKNEANGMNPDIAEDGVHPTLKGYEMMKKLAQEAILK